MSHRDRQLRYFQYGAAAELVRLQILAHPEDRVEILAFVARLRTRRRSDRNRQIRDSIQHPNISRSVIAGVNFQASQKIDVETLVGILRGTIDTQEFDPHLRRLFTRIDGGDIASFLEHHRIDDAEYSNFLKLNGKRLGVGQNNQISAIHQQNSKKVRRHEAS
jgi:hypothetical protein